MVEELVGVIPHVLKATGRIESKHNTVVVTSQRLIIAQFTGIQMQEALAQSKARAKGFIEKLTAGRVLTPKDVVEYSRKYFEMDPDHIAAETPGNISVPVEAIRRIYIDHQVDPEDGDSRIQTDRYILTILADTGESEYVFDADPQDIDVLRKAMGEKVHGDGRAKPIRPPF